MKILWISLSCLMLAAPSAFAGIVLNFTQSTLSGTPGSIVKFFGTLTNTDPFVTFINSDSANITGPGFTIDDSPFLINAPLTMNGNTTTLAFEIIDVTIPSFAAPGSYNGSVAILGGPAANSQNVLGQSTFRVQVNAVTPEPGTMGMLLFGGVAVLLGRRK